MIKIDIISGFLGSGKTTLIKKLLKETLENEKLVIIENEFGEIGIDSGFLNETGINITEMNSGCICCSLVGDFGKALCKVIEEYSPERIIIEPSGVGKLSDVIKAVTDLELNDVVLNSFSTVVDAKKCKIYHKNFGEFFNNQIENAATVILSHVTDISDAKYNDCINIIKELNENALIVTTDWNILSGKQLLNAIENGKSTIEKMLTHDHHGHEHHHHDEHCDCGCHDHHEHEHHHHDEHCDCGCHDHHEHEHHHDEHCDCGCHDHHDHGHHHADDVFTSWGIQTSKSFTENEITEKLNSLIDSDIYGNILRAKGIVPSTNEKWIHFDYVPGESEVRFGHADVTGKICVIGSQINIDALSALFN